MNSIEIFEMALGVGTPWRITDVDLKINEDKKQELNITMAFDRGTKFPDATGALCPVHDTSNKTWRHMNFFQHDCYIHCKVPRIKTTEGKVQLIDVPWARQGSGFTLLFEAMAMHLIEREMPVNKVGEMLGEEPHRIWTIFNYWIKRSYQADTVENVDALGVDETSSRKGHKYVTTVVDLKKRRVLCATEGKGKETIQYAKQYLESKGVKAKQIKHVSSDLSPSFIAGFKAYFPKAEMHFDRFHVVKLLNEAMDHVRKEERKGNKELKGHRYTFLKNEANLTADKKEALLDLTKRFPRLGEAYRLKELFNELWDQPSIKEAELFLESWCHAVSKTDLSPFKKFANTLQKHKKGIVNFVETRINNGVMEGLNSKIQLAKRRARGFRNINNFINMIYFLCGHLKFDYPCVSS